MEQAEFEQRLGGVHEKCQRLISQVLGVFQGEAELIEKLLVAVLARGHVLLEGVPGVAKTTLARSFAQALGCDLRRIQMTPDLLPADITGSYVLEPDRGKFSLRKGPLFTQVLLADELNRAPARTQAALLEAMQESQATIEGERLPLPQPFLVLATQNPSDLEGTYPLPEAQLDRFLLRLRLGYPSEAAEFSMLRTWGRSEPQTSSVFSAAELLEAQNLTRQVHVEDEILNYVLALTRATRKNSQLRLGASPRASLALLISAKAKALLKGRSHVSPEDVAELAYPVLSHRLFPSPEREGDEDWKQEQIEELLAKTPFYRQRGRS